MDDEIIKNRLLPDERILWSGSPRHGVLFNRRDIVLIPMSLLWCGFAIFWETSVCLVHAPRFFLIWGGLFIVAGLYLVAGRFLLDAWIRGGTRYALTNLRVLIAKPKPFSDLTSLNLDRLPDARITETSGGMGTIRFGQAASLIGNQGLSVWTPSLDPAAQFIAIDDARAVFDLIQRLALAKV